MKLLTTIKKIITEGTVITYDDNIVDLYNRLLNKLLSKKYDWFKKLEINRLTLDKGHHGGQSYLGMKGTIYVDSNWAYKQWRKHYYSAPLNHEDLSFGDIVDIDLSKELQSDIKLIYTVVTNNPTPKYMSFSWIEVIPIESDDNDTLTEETSDRMFKVFDTFMLRTFPNFRKDKAMITHKRQPTRRYSIVDPDDFEEFLTPTGFGIDHRMYVIYFPRTNELYVTKDVFDPVIEMFDKNGVQYLIDWVNKEFGFEAEYITI